MAYRTRRRPPKKTRSRIRKTVKKEKPTLKSIIRKNPVVLFIKTYCQYSLKAVQVMKDHKIKHKVVKLDKMGKRGAEFQRQLGILTGRYTVPNVFIKGKSIGGGDETVHLSETGGLTDMVN